MSYNAFISYSHPANGGLARAWLWRPEDLVSQACARLTRSVTPEEWRQHLPEEPYRESC